MARDPRWQKRIILPTLLLQFACAAAVCGLADSQYRNDFRTASSLIPLSAIIFCVLTLVSTATHTICFLTASLHPLVVLTLAVEFAVLWLFQGVSGTLLHTHSWGGGGSCTEDYYNDRLRERYLRGCREGMASAVLSLLLAVSYVWLVTYSAVVRKRTRMPYMTAEQRRELMSRRLPAWPPMDGAGGSVERFRQLEGATTNYPIAAQDPLHPQGHI